MDFWLTNGGAKGQSAFELTSLLIILLLMASLVAALITRQAITASKEQEKELLKEIVNKAQKEIGMAGSVQDGYRRTFLLPDLLFGKNYTIVHVPGHVTFKGNYGELDTLVANTTGTLVKGQNTITKERGRICLNVNPCT